MDPAILEYSGDIPPDVNAATWLRYLRGARAFDELWRRGLHCPNNPNETRCKCDIPRQDYCKYFKGVAALAEEIGGATAEMVRGMT